MTQAVTVALGGGGFFSLGSSGAAIAGYSSGQLHPFNSLKARLQGLLILTFCALCCPLF